VSNRVRHVGRLARKALGDISILEASQIVRNTQRLATAGLRTPNPYLDTDSMELVMPWIEGIGARARLCHGRLYRGYADWSDVPASELSLLVAPLVVLHGAEVVQMELDTFDPWRRIHPRIAHPGCSNNQELMNEIASVIPVLKQDGAMLAESQPAAYVPVHGDYHVGQLLFDLPLGLPWLLDLDDIARGHRESDIGNFAAHCATTTDMGFLGVLNDFTMLSSALHACYADISGINLNVGWINFYGAVAMLRRALKLIELQRLQPETVEIMRAIRLLSAHNRNNTRSAG